MLLKNKRNEMKYHDADGQLWQSEQDTNGVRWFVPVGFPNSLAPVCEESDPEEYAEMSAIALECFDELESKNVPQGIWRIFDE